MRPNTSSLRPTISDATAPRPTLSTPSSRAAALIDLAEHLIGVDLDIVEFDARGIVRVDHRGALDRDAFGFGVDQEQRQPVAGSPAEPPVRAATIRRSAVWPSTTNAFAPLSLKPLPERTACRLICGADDVGALVDRECREQRAV